MCEIQDLHYNKWRAWIRRYSTTLTVGFVMSAGLVYLWNVQCVYMISALSMLVSLGIASLQLVFNARHEINAKHLIVVTGCDSGLGYSLALYCRTLGATVMAGMLEPDSKAAANLKEKGIIVHRLDITDHNNVAQFGENIRNLLDKQALVLFALVNNAGIMIFGEFEWQTIEQIQKQVEVNLLGTMRVTRELMPIIRANASRIIIITSHCAYECLPGLSIYGATKAALLSWSTALRMEVAKFGVKVVSLVPGNFVAESNITARQKHHFEIMEQSMLQEARDFYGDYFTRYATYFGSLPHSKRPQCLTNFNIYQIFGDALCDVCPSAVYKYEPWRYSFFFTLLKITPTWLHDRLTHRFINGPSWTR